MEWHSIWTRCFIRYPKNQSDQNGESPIYVNFTPQLDNSRVLLKSQPDSCTPARVGPRFCSIANLLCLPLYAAKQNTAFED